MKLFTTPRALLISLLAGGALVAAGACGYPTFGFDTTTSSTTGILTGTGGAGGMGSASGGAGGTGGEATSSSASSTASASGTGGGPPVCTITHTGAGTCEYLPGSECGCPDPTTKCAVIEEKTGKSACIKIGASPKPAWSDCDTDTDCAAKTWCDLDLHVCKPICGLVDDCSPGAHCVPVLQSAVNTPIPSLKACTSHCDPQSAAPCGDGLTCFHDSTNNEFDCIRSKKTVVGASCTYLSDCDKGLLCIGSGMTFTCEKWCHPAGNFGGGCPLDKSFCFAFATAVTYEGATYGVCDSP